MTNSEPHHNFFYFQNSSTSGRSAKSEDVPLQECRSTSMSNGGLKHHQNQSLSMASVEDSKEFDPLQQQQQQLKHLQIQASKFFF